MDSKPLVPRTAALVVARLTITRKNGRVMIVEVQADATFHTFYRFYTQDARRRSTKTPLRTASRNEYLPVINSHLYQPGLAVIEKQLRTVCAQSNPIVTSKMRIVKKRAYEKLINAAPDALGLVKVTRQIDPRLMPKPVLRYPVHIPEGHTTITKKWSILLGKSQ